MVTVNDILNDLGYPKDDNNYRLFNLNEGFSFDQLSERDLENHKRLQGFDKDDKLVVVEQGQIIYIED